MAGVALATALIAGCASGPTSTSVPPTSPAVTTTASAGAAATSAAPANATPSPLVLPMQDIEAAGATRIQQGGDWMQVAGGSAWVAVDGGVQRLDGTTGARQGFVIARAICTAMDVGLDRLWAADCDAGTVVAIDPVTAKPKTFKLGGPTAVEEGSVGAGEGAVWIASTESSLVRLDPATGGTKVYPLPGFGAGVRSGLGSVWVTVPTAGQVLRIDPKDGSVIATITAGTEPRFLAIGGDSVWVQNDGDGSVTRIGADGVVKATITVSSSAVDGGDIAYGGGFVWPRISAALIAKLDGTTGELLATYGPPSGSGSVAADESAVWVSAHDVNSVWRLPLN